MSTTLEAIAGPFQIGPIDEPIEVSNQLNFWKHLDNHCQLIDSTNTGCQEASSYLSYGGVLKVVRTDDSDLNNANAGVGVGTNTSLKIKNLDNYEESYSRFTNFTLYAKNPGKWADGLKVCYIDNLADQTLGITTTGISTTVNFNVTVGCAVTAAITGSIPGAGSTSTFTGYLEGIVTGITSTAGESTQSIDVKILKRVSSIGTVTEIDYQKSTHLHHLPLAAHFNSSIQVYQLHTPYHQHHRLIGMTNNNLI